eukprot:TRINITY_DN68182_c7_g1_i1.p1 TRINITY_DN68182_c7_g1~~TRINITY_DN68182_c7_g1_i1.p1  ORF type:complete len:345 (+),score=15.46 TRINITY_DN68182_c7_g1_i1:18-1052(+)
MEHLENAYEAINASFSEMLQRLRETIDQVDLHWSNFKNHRHQLDSKVKQTCASEKLVKLNVGGHKFVSTEGTLLKEPETFFWAMLHSGKWNPDYPLLPSSSFCTCDGSEADADSYPESEYFIDRSPDVFGHLLEYLRAGKMVSLSELPGWQRDQLQRDIDFYQIHSLIASPPEPPFVFKWDDEYIAGDPSLELTRAGATIQRVNKGSGFSCSKYFKASPPMVDVFSWKVTAERVDGSTAWPSSVSAGIGDGTNHDTIVRICFHNGHMWPGNTPFVDWSNPTTRVAKFTFNTKTDQITISSEGCATYRTVPSTDLGAKWVPVVRPFGDTGVRFTIELIPELECAR